MEPRNPSPSWGLSVAIIIAGAIIAGTYYFAQSQNYSTPLPAASPGTALVPVVAGAETQNITIDIDDDDPVLGNPQAPVTIVLFTDFQCPHCRDFHQTTLPQLKRAYVDTGQAAIVFKDFPLSQIHPQAHIAAEAAHCAQDQNAFWSYADQLFQDTRAFDELYLTQTAQTLQLDLTQFTRCLIQHEKTEKVSRNVQAAVAAGISATPTFVINGQLLESALPYEVLAHVIDKAIGPN